MAASTDDSASRLYPGMFVWDPCEKGGLYAVANIMGSGSRWKAVLVRHNGMMGTKLVLKHDRLPEDWMLVNQKELNYLIRQHPSQVRVECN